MRILSNFDKYILLGGLILWCGCSSNDITNPQQIVFPSTHVSFSQSVQPYLTISCNTSGCHDEPNSQNQGITLTSWAQVLSNRVTLAKDTTSPLILVIKGLDPRHGGVIVTPTTNQVMGITQWVREGALNN